MGCVISEVVTWVSQGLEKVLDYRRRRLEEVHQLTGRREESFHDDWGNLLQTVGVVHNENVRNCRRNDELTEPIINGLVSEMLLNSDELRPNARYLYKKSKRIIKDVRGVFDDVTPRRSPNPPLKRPPLGSGSVSSGSTYLEPAQSIPMNSSLNSRPSVGEVSRNPSGLFFSVPSAQNSHQPQGHSNADSYSPPLSPDDNGYFPQKPVYDTFNEYHQSQLAHLPEKTDTWDPRFSDRRSSINDLGSLSPATDSPISRAKRREDYKPPPMLSVEVGLDLIEKKIGFPD